MSEFWLAIVLGFIGSVIANLIHNPLVFLFGKWRLRSRKKRFAREAEFHRLLSDLKTGAIDKHIYLTRICATIVTTFLGSMIAGVGGMILTYTSNAPEAVLLRFMLGALAGFISFYVVAAARHQSIVWGMYNFDKVDADFKEKYGAELHA
jgi:ABC-type multidrug transport system fused ATPase/permease subunit